MKFLDRILGKTPRKQEYEENARLSVLIISTLRSQFVLVQSIPDPIDCLLSADGPTGLGRASGYIFGFASRVYNNANFFDPARTDRLKILLICIFQNLYGDGRGLDLLEATASATPQSHPEVLAGYERGKIDAELWMSEEPWNAPGGLMAICNGLGEDAAPLQ